MHGGRHKPVCAMRFAKGFDTVVTMDADGQHDSSDIPNLIAPLLAAKLTWSLALVRNEGRHCGILRGNGSDICQV